MADGVREALFSAQAEIIPSMCTLSNTPRTLLRSGGDNSGWSGDAYLHVASSPLRRR